MIGQIARAVAGRAAILCTLVQDSTQQEETRTPQGMRSVRVMDPLYNSYVGCRSTFRNGSTMTEPTFSPDDVRRMVRREITNLHLLWSELRTLFGTDDNVAMLTAIANTHYALVYQCFLSQLLLGIARLTDPVEGRGGRDQNLVIARLLHDPALHNDAKAMREVTIAIDLANSACGVLQPHRHKTLAHNDAPTMLSIDDPFPLYAEEIGMALLSLANAYNAYNEAVNLARHEFKPPFRFDSADRLLNTLRESDAWRLHVKLAEERQESTERAAVRLQELEASYSPDEFAD